MSSSGGVKCGAVRGKTGGRCHHPAGYKTGHPGVGPCIFHGGNLPNVIKRIAHLRLMDNLVERGYWTASDRESAHRAMITKSRVRSTLSRIEKAQVSIDYYSALDAMMEDAMGRFIRLKKLVDDIPDDEVSLGTNRNTFARFDTERAFAARIAKDALTADIDKRRLALDEAKADRVLTAVTRAAIDAGLTTEQGEELMQQLAHQMRELPEST